MSKPFATLVASHPGDEVYPAADFRVEWGPIFHRGRLNCTARVLVLGQDPATHETISRRILVGEAGQRLQGLLAKVGITQSYTSWATRSSSATNGIHLSSIRHPTYAEGASRGSGRPLKNTTAEQLANWNDHLQVLAEHVEPESGLDLTPYGTDWAAGDLEPVPERDLPPGVPAWWRDVAAWAVRSGTNAQQKRATMTVTVPKGARSWPPLKK